jgi:thiamine-phosphate pyrophosphorylase
MLNNNFGKELKLIVISSPEGFEGEIKIVHELFELGMRHFHLRKPKFSTEQLKQYLDRINKKYRDRIIIHSHHELCISYKLRGIHLTRKHLKNSFLQSWFRMKYIKMRKPGVEVTAGMHTIGSMKRKNPGYNYVFLSPVFNSISKIGYRSTFNEESLISGLAKSNYEVIAMGGVDEDKIEKARAMGFDGVAILGGLWKSAEPVEKFKRIKELCKATDNTQ